MLKRYVTFMWDINTDSNVKGGWDHVLRDTEGRICSSENKDATVAYGLIRKKQFIDDAPRIAEVTLQIVDLHTGEVVWEER